MKYGIFLLLFSLAFFGVPLRLLVPMAILTGAFIGYVEWLVPHREPKQDKEKTINVR